MKLKLAAFVAVFAFFATKSNAQFGAPSSKIILESGDLSALKSEKKMLLKFDYEGMAVGKFKSEEEYLKTKTKEIEKNKGKEKADEWLAGWKNARAEKYEPKFSDLINKAADDKIVFEEKGNAKYTLIVKTTFTEPGYNIGIMKYPSFVNFDFFVVETANPTNVISKMYVQNVIGQQAMGFDYDVASRVQESYAKAGKMLGKFLLKN